MKTAMSVPNAVFERAERLADRLGKSRSQLYSEAVAEYVARRAPEAITEAVNRACDSVGEARDRLAVAAARRTLRRAEW